MASLNESSGSEDETLPDEEEEEILDATNWEIESYWFVVRRWFAKGEDDGEIVRQLLPTDEDGNVLEKMVEYHVEVTTGKASGAGTDAHVYVNLFGERFDTGQYKLVDCLSGSKNPFEKGKTDAFKMKSAWLGPITKLRVWTDHKGFGADWLLSHINVKDNEQGNEYFFPCGSWLGTGKGKELTKDLLPVDKHKKKAFLKALEENKSSKKAIEVAPDLELEEERVTYRITVVTGKVMLAGTDSDVYITLYGDKDITEDLWLKNSLTNTNKFERGCNDVFEFKLLDIGNLTKIKLRHTDAGPLGDAWFVDKVEIDAPKLGEKWVFPCQKWFDARKGDKLICRELYPSSEETQVYEASESIV